MTKKEYKRYRQIIANGKFRLLAVANTDVDIELDGKPVKPGMMVYQVMNKGHKEYILCGLWP